MVGSDWGIVLMNPEACLGSPRKRAVMVNSTCQLDWAMGCPDVWSNIILGVSVKEFWDEINI